MPALRMRKLPKRLRPLEESLLVLTFALGSIFLVLSVFAEQLYFVLNIGPNAVIHVVMEMAAILVSFSVFIVNWESSKQSRNAQSLFVATGFLTVAAVDLMHTLSSEGMPVFITPNTVDKSIYFWLFARFWAAGVLLAAAFVRPDSRGFHLSRYVLAGANVAVWFILFGVVTGYSDAFPTMFVEGLGLTPLEIGAEYAVILLSLVAAIFHARRYRAVGDSSLVILVSALVVGIFSEFFFTMFRDPADVYSMLGHAYKVTAYYLIFRALLVSSVERPYLQLRQAKESLEHTVIELNARTRELDALDEVALTLSSSLRPDELLHSAIDKVMAVMQAEAGAIFLVDEETGQLKLSAWRGLKASAVAQYQAHSIRLSYGDPDRSEVCTTLEDPGVVRTLGGTEARIAVLGACVCAPVTTKGRVLGAIAMLAAKSRAFAPADSDLLTAVGYQLGLAIENAQLYGRTDEQLREKLRELERAERKATFLAEAAALLASSMEQSRVLNLLARKATEVVGDWCGIYLLDDRESVLHLEAVHHVDDEELTIFRRLLGRNPVRVGSGAVGEVAQSGEAKLVVGEQLQRFTSYLQGLVDSVEEVAVVHRILPSSAIVAPMRARGKTLGVLLVLETHTPDLLRESELALVAELGDRAGVAIDNSQLFQASQAQRRHLEAIISQMLDGVVIADAEGQLLVTNVAAERMLGGQFGDLLEGPEAPAPDNYLAISPVRLPLIRRALDGESLLAEEICIASDSGERILSASATAIRDERGETSGAVVVLRDVTAEREIDRMKDEFVATVSHELRTPITAVLGYSDLMLRGLRGPLTQPQTDAMNSVRNAGHRLLRLIEDLLDISKLEAGKQELLLEVVSVPTAVSRAVSAVAFLAGAKKIRLEESIPRRLPLVIADEGQLQQILANLLSNAVKFTPEGGTVTIGASVSEDGVEGEPGSEEAEAQRWVTMTVTDTGTGIPLDKQEKIWEKFQQVDSSSSRAHGGTGLGLAIVKGLVELHGGRVWVESQGAVGQGSTFSFTLPTVRVAP